MAQAAAKRFYKHAGTAADEEGGIVVVLDGRAVKTPAGRKLHLPKAPLAEAVAAEWEAQDDTINPDTMPLTQLAITALDRMADDRSAVVAALSAFGGTDLLCYWADGPEDLVRRESAVWQPLLDWAAETFDAPLDVTSGVLPVEQPAGSLTALADAVWALDDFELAVLGTLTPAFGSLVLGLALLKGRLSAQEAIDAAFVDEAFQAERWGVDKEAEDRRRVIGCEVVNADKFLQMLRA